MYSKIEESTKNRIFEKKSNIWKSITQLEPSYTGGKSLPNN